MKFIHGYENAGSNDKDVSEGRRGEGREGGRGTGGRERVKKILVHEMHHISCYKQEVEQSLNLRSPRT